MTTSWLHTPDDLTDRYTRQWGPYTLTVSRALFRWWWTIRAPDGTHQQSDPLYTTYEDAQRSAEKVMEILDAERGTED